MICQHTGNIDCPACDPKRALIQSRHQPITSWEIVNCCLCGQPIHLTDIAALIRSEVHLGNLYLCQKCPTGGDMSKTLFQTDQTIQEWANLEDKNAPGATYCGKL